MPPHIETTTINEMDRQKKGIQLTQGFCVSGRTIGIKTFGQ